MRRVTVLFDDERLYWELKAEALEDWLRRRTGLSPAERERRQSALRLADALRARQPLHETIDDTLAAIREERS